MTRGRVLGIDPGLRVTGYGCVAMEGHAPRLIEGGVIRLARGGATRPVADRLFELDRDLAALLDRLRPGLVAVEALFSHPKHPSSALVMAHARGVILLRARSAGVELAEVRPASVKRFIVGHGQAGKGQVQRAVKEALRLAETPKPADVADALAIALCAAQRREVALRWVGD